MIIYETWVHNSVIKQHIEFFCYHDYFLSINSESFSNHLHFIRKPGILKQMICKSLYRKEKAAFGYLESAIDTEIC